MKNLKILHTQSNLMQKNMIPFARLTHAKGYFYALLIQISAILITNGRNATTIA